MGNKENQNLKAQYLAHVDFAVGRKQFAEEHFGNVASFAERVCPLPEIRTLAYLTGILHDAGKLGEENQKDFQNILELGDQVHKHNLDHSTAGGRILEELLKEPIVSEMLSDVVYFHHGVSDCIEMETGKAVQIQRREKEIEIDRIKERFYSLYAREMLEEKSTEALEQYKDINHRIGSFLKDCKASQKKCGDGYFYIGMYFRVLLSLLIDGDWTDTACFFQGVPVKLRTSPLELQKIWQLCIQNFEEYMEREVVSNPDNGNMLNVYRQEISDACRKAADREERLYRLTVPTGAGKTLSSLRFALYHAQVKQKQHIIYVAPFNSILEQNAEEIRKAVKNSEIVLEHHCNVICEEGEEERYRNLTETWDSPIIVTTAVQLLNTLFSDKKSYIRRMHTLCNSIIIFDEVQAIPVRCTELFNEAVNFLFQFGNTTVVLCSATQPTYATLKENNVYTCIEMAGETKKYAEAFKRTNIIDYTRKYPGGMSIEDLKEFACEQVSSYQSVLVIVNTTSCARKLFQALKEEKPQEYRLFHISNNMCPKHKLDTLTEIKKALKENKKKIICVSTQVVEAGVNFSFGCVIRSKAGLDNVIQSAGRCNRHKEFFENGVVYIIQMVKEAENLEHLHEIRDSQTALQKVLDDFKLNRERFCYALDSQEAISEYYKNYYNQLRTDETKFPVEKYPVVLVDLLGKNTLARSQYERFYKKKISSHSLAQAFSTAGEAFEVIADNYKIGIVVPYNSEARDLIADLSADNLEIADQKRTLRKLQRYTVGIGKYRKEKLGNALYSLCQGEILVLCEGYYSEETGVSDDSVQTYCMM